MTEDQKIYHELAEALIDGIPEDWTQAKIIVHRAENQRTRSSWYKSLPSNEWISFEDRISSLRFRNWVNSLYSFGKENNFNEWNTFTLEVSENGEFSITFQWDEGFYNETQ